MKHKTSFVLLLLAIVMTGCLKVQKKSEKAAAERKAKSTMVQPKQVLTRELRLDDIFIEFIGQSEPNVYDMVFSWPATRDRVRLSLNGEELFVGDTSEIPSFTRSGLPGGQSYTVHVEILDQQNHIIDQEHREREVPIDYVFNKELRLIGDMRIVNYERVFMFDAVITTSNFNLLIKTKKLVVVSKSNIQGFDEGAQASPANSGLSGGNVSIEAEEAQGILNFNMNSQAGGRGLNGYLEERCHMKGECHVRKICPQGGNGYSAGKNGDLRLKIKDVSGFFKEVTSGNSRGGAIGTANGSPTIEGTGYICSESPIAGSDALPGKVCITFQDVVPEKGCE